MRVYLLGTGTLEPQAERASTSLAVETRSERVFLDFGRNALSRAIECGLDPLRARTLFLTHLHPDHCCELVSLFFARNYHRQTHRTATEDLRPALRLLGPPGTVELVEAIGAAWRWCRPQFELRIDEIGGEWSDAFGEMEITAHAVSHGDHAALGYRIEGEGSSIAFTGDTGPGAAVVELARGVDLLIAECGQREGDGRGVHLGVEDLIELIRASEPARVVLTHFYPEIDRDAACRRIRAECGCEVLLAEDRMGLDLGGVDGSELA